MTPSNLQSMRISLVLRASIMALALVGWMAAPALAAPSVVSSTPEDGAEMHEPPGEVTIEFSEPLQDSSGMTVTDGCGNDVGEGDARIVGTAMNELNVVVGDAPYSGEYTVDYVATGVTGTTSGSLSFIVHGGKNCDGSGGGGGGGGGGEHNGHGNGGGNGGGGNGGGGHNGGHGGGSGGGEHQGGGSGHRGGQTTGHNGGGDHSGTGAMSDHKNMNHKNKDHKNMNHNKNKHENHKDTKKNGNGGGGPIAGPGDFTVATDIPTGSTVAIALGLAILMGLIGGWVLRVSNPN
jgi:methionine-rich copper-binding protein CopC